MLCGTWSSTTTVGALVHVLWKFSVGVKMFLNVLDNFFVRFGKSSYLFSQGVSSVTRSTDQRIMQCKQVTSFSFFKKLKLY